MVIPSGPSAWMIFSALSTSEESEKASTAHLTGVEGSVKGGGLGDAGFSSKGTVRRTKKGNSKSMSSTCQLDVTQLLAETH